MNKTIKLLITLATAITALAAALTLITVFWDSIVSLCPDCKAKSKLPTKDQLIRKMPWKKNDIEAEFADYEDF